MTAVWKFAALGVSAGFVVGMWGIDLSGQDPAQAHDPALAQHQNTAEADPFHKRTLDDLLAEHTAVSVARLAGETWQLACLSRGPQPAPTGMSECWPAGTDRNLGGSFLNVVRQDGACAQWRTSRPIIHKRFDDTLCLAEAELPGLLLRDAGKIVDIE